MCKPQQSNKLASFDKVEKTLRGLVGTPKAEVDAEAKKEQRRKAKSKGKKR